MPSIESYKTADGVQAITKVDALEYHVTGGLARINGPFDTIEGAVIICKQGGGLSFLSNATGTLKRCKIIEKQGAHFYGQRNYLPGGTARITGNDQNLVTFDNCTWEVFNTAQPNDFDIGGFAAPAFTNCNVTIYAGSFQGIGWDSPNVIAQGLSIENRTKDTGYLEEGQIRPPIFNSIFAQKAQGLAFIDADKGVHAYEGWSSEISQI